MTTSPADAPNEPASLEIDFVKGCCLLIYKSLNNLVRNLRRRLPNKLKEPQHKRHLYRPFEPVLLPERFGRETWYRTNRHRGKPFCRLESI